MSIRHAHTKMRHQRTMSHMNTSCGRVSFCIAQKKKKCSLRNYGPFAAQSVDDEESLFFLICPKKMAWTSGICCTGCGGGRVFFKKSTFAAQDREILLVIRLKKKTGPLEGLGVFAAQDVEAGESLFDIPQSCCIYPELVFADRQLGLFFFPFFSFRDDENHFVLKIEEYPMITGKSSFFKITESFWC